MNEIETVVAKLLTIYPDLFSEQIDIKIQSLATYFQNDVVLSEIKNAMDAADADELRGWLSEVL